MYEHFDLITKLKYKCETCQFFIHSFQKNYDECKMKLVNNRFNTFKVRFNSCANVDYSKDERF